MMTKENLTILGIETSCDDTAAAIVRLTHDGERIILANDVWAQHDDHAHFGGVVPEIAARSHVERLDGLIARAMTKAAITYNDLDGVAVTAGPGLVGGVVVGLMTAKAICISHNLPLIPINHLEGHALSVRLTETAPFPYLLLLVSGGHTQLIEVNSLGHYRRLGTTIDDAAGEAFDKTAKLLGLGQPGGPNIEKIATKGNPTRFALPKPLKNRPGCDFSFSGLKTAVRVAAQPLKNPTQQDIADLAAGFQYAAATHLCQRSARAIDMFEDNNQTDTDNDRPYQLVAAGGVAANHFIRKGLADLAQSKGWVMIVPPTKLCTDNGAMIAWAGLERLRANRNNAPHQHNTDHPFIPSRSDALALAPRARWPLAPPPLGYAFGSGKKGPKA